MSVIRIAVLLTCFNRKEFTVSCLNRLKQARDEYNKHYDNTISMSIFLTDDHCTDGTPEAVKGCLCDEDLHIIEADGFAYWAGGMRLAWKEALRCNDYDFFLLLNDDTDVWENLFDQLLSAHQYCIDKSGLGGVYSGNTTWKNDHGKMSFGGKKGTNGLIKRYHWIYPNGVPQACDIVNANILMVSSEVVRQVGIFPECYKHGAADNDYGMRANHAGYPVVITSDYCGSCDADNYDHEAECKRLKSMSFKEKKRYFSNPVHSIHDKMAFAIRWRKTFVPVLLLLHAIHFLFPSVYAKLMNGIH